MLNTTALEKAVKPTPELYDALQQAYEFINARLFDDHLLHCLITLQRRNRAYGYFSARRFTRSDGQARDEIALNPSYFPTRSLAETLATLAHEMVHLWQHHFGTPGRRGYHNREWADKMISIGLQPTNTGAVGGRETGDSMTHFILENGPFAKAINELEHRRFSLRWAESLPSSDSNETTGGNADESSEDELKSGNRYRYECPRFEECRQSAYSGKHADFSCNKHDLNMVVVPPKRRRQPTNGVAAALDTL